MVAFFIGWSQEDHSTCREVVHHVDGCYQLRSLLRVVFFMISRGE